ncbi:MAG TPA: adenylate/guanylate cyclase domain-containing protein [Desulfatiglandales bacterium]|nr:adenylate/guanylate cyclase domain-containing protein [Desulfatiglandales bacterium]
MGRENVTLAILFADIAKSTHLYETLGNKTAQSLIGTCLSLLAKITAQHNGTVIKTIGDEIMCTFPTADNAVEAAIAMNRDLERLTISDMPGVAPPNIYVGIQFGPVIREDNDVFGDAVNVAARMVSMAKQRQIVTTDDTVLALSAQYKSSTRVIDKTTVKGKSGEMNIYEVIWEKQDATVMVDESLDARKIESRMQLKFQGVTVEIDQNRPSITLGRQAHNDIVVNDERVSRTHARIEYRRGKFILIDQSTNGTFALIQGKKTVTLRRDEATLLGNGIIGLGREVNDQSPVAIHYSIQLC